VENRGQTNRSPRLLPYEYARAISSTAQSGDRFAGAHRRELVGVSGAGKKLAEDYLYAERSESAKAYKLTKHQHLAEVEEQLGFLTGAPTVIQFNPHLAPMRRGIATTITVPAVEADIAKLYATWEAAYSDSPFVSILPTGDTPDTAHVVGSNRIDMSAAYDERTKNFVITSAEDNLMKGASGQGVQIMNLWCGFPETAGLV
jgi:N-acetyl-gamma-glutamyl-phosphate reductase